MSDENKELLSNTLALNLALQTIKERCVHLQKRLHALESENSRLRLNTINNDKKNESYFDNSINLSEVEELRSKNAELTLQKNQLSENLTMISTENRKLWKRLSQLTKDNVEDEQNNGTLDTSKLQANQNLVRSKTFTQTSPHQLLKEKLVGHQVGPDDSELEDVSLLNDYVFSTEKLTFSQDDNESSVDSKMCTEGMFNIKKELMKQNSDLKVALSNWRKLKSTDVCSCKTQETNIKKPEMVDKSLETDRVTIELEMDKNNFEISKHDNIEIDLSEEKRAADKADKICPMCGKFYTQNILFEEFQEHVESHFRDDNDDLEQLSLDHAFELVSHTVGNF